MRLQHEHQVHGEPPGSAVSRRLTGSHMSSLLAEKYGIMRKEGNRIDAAGH